MYNVQVEQACNPEDELFADFRPLQLQLAEQINRLPDLILGSVDSGSELGILMRGMLNTVPIVCMNVMKTMAGPVSWPI
eukprot:COSAG06_NODE_5427_length_3487_cov_3.967237_3_plen_79_part_00